MRMRRSLLFFIALLVFVSLACQQSGDILTEEDATARAQEGIFRPGDGSSVAGAELAIGDSAEVIGSGFLINLLDAPGGTIAGSQSRGSTVEILGSAEFEGEIWYQVDSQTGSGWLKAESLEVVEATEEEGSTAEGEEAAPDGPAEGDTVYLISTGFLVNLLKEPNGQIQAVQERGVAVTIEDIFVTPEDETWYLISAPTGQGWVSIDNISEEAP